MNYQDIVRRKYEDIHAGWGIPRTPEPVQEIVYVEEEPSYREIAVRPHVRRVRC